MAELTERIQLTREHRNLILKYVTAHQNHCRRGI